VIAIGSLFSGIGGLELGLERAGLGPTVWQVERDPFCRRVLERHWPEVRRHDDVRRVGAANLQRVELICGGFPCQDVSSAGKKAGLAGARSGLWFEFHRVVGELRPAWVVVENVAGGARSWVDEVVGGLDELGYACLSVPLAAADVGAPHLRSRIFIVAAADAHEQGEPARAEHAEVAGASSVADAQRAAVRVEQGRASGPRGRRQAQPPEHREGHAADARGARLEGARSEAQEGRQRPAERSWRTPAPDMVRVVHGLPRRMDGSRPRISALGNAVVPECAEVIGHLILELAKQPRLRRRP
jgi:DNA (cytosine-5)-methyltransferase 1